jgi:hypothetical protein
MMENLGAEWYFESAGLKKTADEIRRLIGTSKKSLKLQDFQNGLPVILSSFEKEYCKDSTSTSLFKAEKDLLDKARSTTPQMLDQAWKDVNLSEEFSGPSTHYVDQVLNVYSNQIEDYFVSKVSPDGTAGSLPVRIEDIRYLRLCLTYMFFSESLFDEITLFHYKLIEALGMVTIPKGSSPPTSTKGYAEKLRAAGYGQLVQGYESVVRNGIAHRHIATEESRAWTFTDPRDKTSGPISADYGQFKSNYYEPMKSMIQLWELFTVLHTLEGFANQELH